LFSNLLREPARRELTLIQIARRALIEIRDDVRRVLNYESDESSASLPANIIAEREYPYDANDYSLIAPNNDNAANLRVEQMTLDAQTHLTKAYSDLTTYFKH